MFGCVGVSSVDLQLRSKVGDAGREREGGELEGGKNSDKSERL